MVVWPCPVPVPEMADDNLLSTAPGSGKEPISKAAASVLGYFVHSIGYSDILLDVLRCVKPPCQPHS